MIGDAKKVLVFCNNILISSDTIARGIDIPGITAVINYDIAKYAETFIHRSGRTARARGELAGNET